MADVWFVVPTKAAPMNKLGMWRDRGYKVWTFQDVGDPMATCDAVTFGVYEGYAKAVNQLVTGVLSMHSGVQWIVTGGDDYSPDMNIDPQKIAQECTEHFKGTFGVMQPTGDRWMVDQNGLCASERVCDCPWMGVDFCRRMYGGIGPLWPEYRHWFVDEELHEVASKLGVLWHRPDIRQFHYHWSRTGKARPEYLRNLNWEQAKDLYFSRKAAGFPGHEPLVW